MSPVSESYDAGWAEETVARLKGVGIDFAAGLTVQEFDAIENSFGVAMPTELALLLTAGVPISEKWARWPDGPEMVAQDTRSWIDRAFEFDITVGDYWHPLLGERPESDTEAVAQALEVVHAASPLMPIYAHRFITTTSANGPRPVLSVWQAVDSIIYGNDLADYLAREFRIERPRWAAAQPAGVPVWDELFDIYGTETGASKPALIVNPGLTAWPPAVTTGFVHSSRPWLNSGWRR